MRESMEDALARALKEHEVTSTSALLVPANQEDELLIAGFRVSASINGVLKAHDTLDKFIHSAQKADDSAADLSLLSSKFKLLVCM